MVTGFLLAALALGAPAPKVAAKPADTLVGEWVVESLTFGGADQPPKRSAVYMRFDADGKGFARNGSVGEFSPHSTYTADLTARPMAVDFDFDPDGRINPKLNMRGIFKVEGDTLIICLSNSANGKRPTAFDAPSGAGRLLYVLKRVKKVD